MQEIWKPVLYRNIKLGMYEVSNYGRIRNSHTKHIMALVPSEKNYMMACFRCTDNRTRTIKVHRIVASSFVSGKTSERCEVNHIDGNKRNNCANNLEWCTRSDNIRHGIKSGLIPIMRGSLNGNSIINENTAVIVCETLRSYCGNIARTLNTLRHIGIIINKQQLFDIKRKRTWRHISDKYFTLEFIFGITKLNILIVNLTCDLIVRYEGDIGDIQKFLKSLDVTVPDEYITAIKNKIYWVKVSNKYFKNEYKTNRPVYESSTTIETNSNI